MRRAQWILSFAITAALALSACSGTPTREACFKCTERAQGWEDFGFAKLEGTWRGKQERFNNLAEGKSKRLKPRDIEVAFLEGRKFLNAYRIANSSCGEFPANAVVLMNEMWWGKAGKRANERAFEVFGRRDDGNVSYGRAYISRGATNTCKYESVIEKVVMNRLALPSVHYSKRITIDGRVLASGETEEVDIGFEFLHYDDAKIKEEYRWLGDRSQASNPPLFFRFVKTKRKVTGPFDTGRWESTEERIFRLWRLEEPANVRTPASDDEDNPEQAKADFGNRGVDRMAH